MSDFFSPATRWCWHGTTPSGTPGFFLFRREFSLKHPKAITFRVSADNRYNFYIDGELAGRGPARGDLTHYRYETFTRELTAGYHVLTAEVVVYRLPFTGESGPWSEIHTGGGFICDALTPEENLSTPNGWQAAVDFSRRHAEWPGRAVPAPPLEDVDFSLIPGGAAGKWRTPGCSLKQMWTAWSSVKEVGRPFFAADGHGDPTTRWHLEPSPLPQMESTPWPIAKILQNTAPACTGAPHLAIDGGRLCGSLPTGEYTVLIDLGRNQTSIIKLKGSSGGGTCRIAYAEGLFVDGKRGHRGPVNGGSIGEHGYADILRLANGEWLFESFWYRSGRYIELTCNFTVPVADFSLEVEFIAYPFPRAATLSLPDTPALSAIYDAAWHTARCCAHEHYEDCPYWEQMQYVGDTRIQALISYAATGDGRLGRQAIRQFDNSRLPFGLTQSRYPTNYLQVIPEFSLFWVLMVEDYFRYFGDTAVIHEHWRGINNVLDWFEEHRETSGLIGPVGYWNVTDWSPQWPGGMSDRGEHQHPETIINLIYADCCHAAEHLALAAELPGSNFAARAQQTIDAVNLHCYSAERGLYRDVPGKEWYSQHVNAWAVLAGAAAPERRKPLMQAVLNDETLAPCTLYFAFYLLEMLRRTGQENEFEQLLTAKWQPMLDLGFTTFPECPDLGTRSDCHAWSAAPVYEIIRFYAGVRPGERDREITLKPRCGTLKRFAATVPAGRGCWLNLAWERDGDDLRLTLTPDQNIRVRLVTPYGEKDSEEILAGQTAVMRMRYRK